MWGKTGTKYPNWRSNKQTFIYLPNRLCKIQSTLLVFFLQWYLQRSATLLAVVGLVFNAM